MSICGGCNSEVGFGDTRLLLCNCIGDNLRLAASRTGGQECCQVMMGQRL